MQPPKTAPRRTQLNATANIASRRIGVGVVIAGGLAAAMLASAAPAAAINPGGGRHRVQVERQQKATQHAQAHDSVPAADDSLLDQEMYRLRMCESHNNYQDNTGNGYYGAYQFALQTWQDLGLTGRPDQASPAVQDYAAKVLHSHAGWGPWPACSRREHLR